MMMMIDEVLVEVLDEAVPVPGVCLPCCLLLEQCRQCMRHASESVTPLTNVMASCLTCVGALHKFPTQRAALSKRGSVCLTKELAVM